MAVVIRLQGLRIDAGSADIRNFFNGLKIPDGGVHVIGGPLEEAFIIFATDEHARRAMARSGGCIKGSPINLLLSSRAEMQNVLEENSKRTEMSKSWPYNEGFRRAETNMPSHTIAESLSVEERIMDHLGMDGISGPAVEERMPVHQGRKSLGVGNDGFYLNLRRLPFSITREDVRVFFQGLLVKGIILMKNRRGQQNGMGLVKFAAIRDAYEGLMRDRKYIGNRLIEINPSSEKQWIEAGGSVEPHGGHTAEFLRESSPPNMDRRYPRQCTRSISPIRHRSRSSSPSDNEYCILIENLSYSVDKRELREFFKPVELKEDQIFHLLDLKSQKRTRSAFVLFRSLKDYYVGLTRHKENLANRTIYVSPISKERMAAMLESPDQEMGKYQEKPSTSLERSQHSQKPKLKSERICIYIRNLPFDVRKVEIVEFFQGFGVSKDMVHLLLDEKGAELGEALVTFNSEEEALRAECLHGMRFLGSEVMVQCISRMQMREFGVKEKPKKSLELPLKVRSPEGYSARQEEVREFPINEEYPDIKIPCDDHVPLPVRSRGSSSRFDSCKNGRDAVVNREGGSTHRGLGNQFDGPACLKLINLPLNISIDEIYDFCHGFKVIPGSVSLHFYKDGSPKGCATVVFESRQEAQTAIQELGGRPIGTKKIHLFFL